MISRQSTFCVSFTTVSQLFNSQEITVIFSTPSMCRFRYVPVITEKRTVFFFGVMSNSFVRFPFTVVLPSNSQQILQREWKPFERIHISGININPRQANFEYCKLLYILLQSAFYILSDIHFKLLLFHNKMYQAVLFLLARFSDKLNYIKRYLLLNFSQNTLRC